MGYYFVIRLTNLFTASQIEKIFTTINDITIELDYDFLAEIITYKDGKAIGFRNELKPMENDEKSIGYKNNSEIMTYTTLQFFWKKMKKLSLKLPQS